MSENTPCPSQEVVRAMVRVESNLSMGSVPEENVRRDLDMLRSALETPSQYDEFRRALVGVYEWWLERQEARRSGRPLPEPRYTRSWSPRP